MKYKAPSWKPRNLWILGTKEHRSHPSLVPSALVWQQSTGGVCLPLAWQTHPGSRCAAGSKPPWPGTCHRRSTGAGWPSGWSWCQHQSHHHRSCDNINIELGECSSKTAMPALRVTGKESVIKYYHIATQSTQCTSSECLIKMEKTQWRALRVINSWSGLSTSKGDRKWKLGWGGGCLIMSKVEI